MSNRTRQPWRLGTKLALCGVALALITYNLRGKAGGSPKDHVWWKSIESRSPRDAAAWSRWEHGWPLSCLHQARYRWYNESQQGQIYRAQILAEVPRWLLPPFDSIFQGVGPTPKFSLILFSLNLAVALVILASTARMTDKWLRAYVKPLKIRIKRPVWTRRFQYGLGTLLCLPVLLGIILSFIWAVTETRVPRIERILELIIFYFLILPALGILVWAVRKDCPMRSILCGYLVLLLVGIALFTAIRVDPLILDIPYGSAASLVLGQVIGLWVFSVLIGGGVYFSIRWIHRRSWPNQWDRRRVLIALMVVLWTMAVTLLDDSSLRCFPGILVWLSSAFLGWGILCTLARIAMWFADWVGGNSEIAVS